MMKHFLSSLLVVMAICLIGNTQATAQSHNNFEISKSLDIYATILRELNLNYVDDISAGELNQIAIDAMLQSLDPYTVFVPESQIEDFQLMTTGEYGGIGALIQQIGDKIYISEPYEGFPAHKTGLKAGDRILEVNGLSTKGKASSEISELLKGQPGTSLQMLIQREGIASPINKEIVRERIRIDNIPYTTVFDNGIGYILLTGFTQKAAAEVKKTFMDMKESHELK
jgi:carboxyl-terminal processing protease